MCVGALLHARVGEVVYGAAEPKTGALVSTARLLDIPQLNHRFVVTGGVLETEARDLIQQFFRGSGRRERPSLWSRRIRDRYNCVFASSRGRG